MSAQYHPLHVWNWLTPIPISSDLNIVVHDGHQFLAGGIEKTLVSSRDGLNWNALGSLPADNVKAIHSHAGNIYVLDEPRETFRSVNGGPFESQTNLLAGADVDLGWCQGRLLLGGRPMYVSTNGLHWQRIPSISTISLAISTNLALALTPTRKLLLTTNSYDWVDITPKLPDGLSMLGLSRAGSLWIAAGTKGSLLVSTNAHDWAVAVKPLVNLTQFMQKSALLHQGEYWIRKSTNWWRSSDGLQWSIDTNAVVPLIAETNPFGIASDNTVAIAVGKNGVTMRSTNLVEWTTIGGPRTLLSYQKLYHHDGLFISTTYKPGSVPASPSTAFFSTNSRDWKEIPFPSEFLPHAFAFGKGVHIASGTSSNHILLLSSDLTNWAPVPPPTKRPFEFLSFQEGLFLASGGSQGIWVSSNGIQWTQVIEGIPSGTSFAFTAFKGVYYLAKGTNIATSSDGLRWKTERTPPDFYQTYTISSPNRLIISMGPIMAVTQDGIHWNTNTIPQFSEAIAMTYGNGYFLMFSFTGALRYSQDGLHWTRTQFYTGAPAGVIFNNGRFLMSTQTGSLLESDPLIYLSLDPSQLGSAQLYGSEGARYNIESTTSLQETPTWSPILNLELRTSPQRIELPISPGAFLQRGQFFRARQEP